MLIQSFDPNLPPKMKNSDAEYNEAYEDSYSKYNNDRHTIGK